MAIPSQNLIVAGAAAADSEATTSKPLIEPPPIITAETQPTIIKPIEQTSTPTSTTIRCINGVIIGLVVTVILCTMWIFSHQSPYVQERGDDPRMLQMVTLFVGILVWPLVWHVLLGYELLYKYPVLFVAFLWPMLVTLYQIRDDHDDQQEDMSDLVGRRKQHNAAVQTDSTTLISTAFAMGGIFMILPKLNDNQHLMQSAAYMVIVALLICIALTLPNTQHIVNSQRYTNVFRMVQRLALNYALGLIMASLILIVSNSRPDLI